MTERPPHLLLRTPVLGLALCLAVSAPAHVSTQTDLDAFMRQVLAKRDDNWKKLQQYVLDEREAMELRGPDRTPMWGEHREYTWYIRDGFFVRSPLKFNGVTIAEPERRKFEADYLRREQQRERRRGRAQAIDPVEKDTAPTVQSDADAPRNVDGLIKQTREPQFISSAYFLRFKFEEGKYALVGHETLDGRDLLRIEYYPARMFTGSDRRRTGRGQSEADKARDAEFRRLMNKVALVTLWVEPNAHQIVKYTFDNVAFDFLPVGWLMHVNDLNASMTMGQPFKDVWLPNALEATLNMTLAVGPFDLHYTLDYHDYRQPDVTSKIRIPEDR
ncbi:MAG: hypothetical protein HY047_17420 [Acidobacteria bacterium]|nr:hypothetical protein [Acidobacteriota bacterium]